MKLVKNNQYITLSNYLINNKLSLSSGNEEQSKMNIEINKSNNDIFVKNLSEKKEKQCPLGKNCPNYKKYIFLKNELKGLITSINKIKKINDVLSKSLENKSKLYKYLIDENENLKKQIYFITKKKYSSNFNISEKSDILELLHKEKPARAYRVNSDIFYKEKKPAVNIKLNNNSKLKNLFLNSIISYERNKSNNDNIFKNKNFKSLKTINVSFLSPKKLKLINNDLNTNAIYNKNKLHNHLSEKKVRNYNIINNDNPEIYYDLINKYTKQQKTKFISDKMKRSFLSHNIDYETLIKNNNSLNKLIYLTQSEDIFISIINSSSEEDLLKYFDMINLLISDYKEMLNLGIRMKNFIKNSISFIESIIDNNSIKVLIENTCNILSCDRASLFILDKISDSLIVYSGEGIKKAQIKVPKDIGIVGACFMEMKKIRIDDAYLDKRFNKEIDKTTNYRTRSILCYPLIDKYGECFGVIEAINKTIPPFNVDDEELIKLLSFQANIIFRSLNSYDDNRYLTLKLMLIVNYIISINNINNKYEFTQITEDAMLNIFDCMNSKFYFIENGKITHYNYNKDKNKIIEFDINNGIIGKVIKIKDILGYQSIKNSVEYNSIIDIDSSD